MKFAGRTQQNGFAIRQSIFLLKAGRFATPSNVYQDTQN